MTADSRALELCKRYDRLKSDRSTFESHWEDIAERVLPRHSGRFQDPAENRPRGEKKTANMFDATAAMGNERFAAAMESMLTPRNGKWHSLQASHLEIRERRDVRLWFDYARDVLFQWRYRPKAAFSTNIHECYIGLGAFGTAVLFIQEDLSGRGIRYNAMPLSAVYIATNFQGVVDTVYRPFWYSARQAIQRFGREALSEKLLSKAAKEPDERFMFMHVVQPRDDYDANRLDNRGKPFASIFLEYEEKRIVGEGGYFTFPYAISRYVTAPEEDYGRSPAMLALPSIKVLNEQKKTMLKQGHRVVDPVLLAYDDGVLDTFSLKPGDVNYGAMTKDGRRLVDVLPTGNLAAGQELMDMERAVINDAFLVTLFQILVETPQMTATEVLERAREKGALISPTMGRQQTEMLGPCIERELDILGRQGLLPPMPDALAMVQGEYEVEYDSPLSRAQKAEEASGALRSLEVALQYAGQTGDMSPLDHFDMDVITPELMHINGVPERWKRPMEAIEQIRMQRQQQAEMQQAIEAAPAIAGVAKAAA